MLIITYDSTWTLSLLTEQYLKNYKNSNDSSNKIFRTKHLKQLLKTGGRIDFFTDSDTIFNRNALLLGWGI